MKNPTRERNAAKIIQDRRDRRANSQITCEELWARFYADKSELNLAKLVEFYTPFVNGVAKGLVIELVGSVDVRDLTNAGIFGLVDSIKRFDPTRGFKFETYAGYRVRGAMLDAIRNDDWCPRYIRQKARILEQTKSNLEQKLRRKPTREEIANALEMSEKELDQIESAIDIATQHSLEVPITGHAIDSIPGAELKDFLLSDDDVVEEVMQNVQEAHLAEALALLSEKERSVLMMRFYDGLTQDQIGEYFDVSGSRICQIQAKALKKLADHMFILENPSLGLSIGPTPNGKQSLRIARDVIARQSA